MLSFELSVIDIVLAMAIIVILLLQLKKAPTESPSEQKLLGKKGKPLEDLEKIPITRKTSRKKESLTHTPEGSLGCTYHFGYLKTLPKEGSIPESCYSCSRMRECLFSNK